MHKLVLLLVFIVLVAVAGVFSYWSLHQADMLADVTDELVEAKGLEMLPPPTEKSKPVPTQVQLEVPYVNEAPDGVWAGPWKNACEEAAVLMVERYYRGDKEVSVADAKKAMQVMFAEQDRVWGSNANSDAARTLAFINSLKLFNAEIVESPSIDAIKTELVAGRPVITLNRGFDLHNPNIPFLATGSSYHALVIVGFDDATKEFIVHDTGDTKQGAYHKYTYKVLMSSLHDYNFQTKKADGPARVLFTGRL